MEGKRKPGLGEKHDKKIFDLMKRKKKICSKFDEISRTTISNKQLALHINHTLSFQKTTRATKQTCCILASETLIGAMDWPIESTIDGIIFRHAL